MPGAMPGGGWVYALYLKKKNRYYEKYVLILIKIKKKQANYNEISFIMNISFVIKENQT